MEQKLQYIVDKIGELNIQINEKQAEQFFRYYELLVEWNGFMNLTGQKVPSQKPKSRMRVL